jgi:transglutaminase-like putative cysteine protease
VKRHRFLSQVGACAIVAATPALARANSNASFTPGKGPWRTFEIVTEVVLPDSATPVCAWIPVPTFTESEWMQPKTTTWDGNATSVVMTRDPKWNVGMVFAQWLQSNGAATLSVSSIVSTKDRYVDLSKPQQGAPLSPEERALYTSATRFLPTDGIVASTAQKIVGSTDDDLSKSQAIYNWVVENSARNPKTRGCGLGNVSFMLETGDLTGKCADINGLFVALNRAVGIPARDLYGIRVAPSAFGYKSLGASSNVITKAQHCRAEVYLSHYGWVPADPADVRKVMLEEPPGNRPIEDPKVLAARNALFGSWEGNYVAFNDGHDVALPGSKGADVAFLMYPQAEVQNARRDSLSADDFVYTIHSTQVQPV